MGFFNWIGNAPSRLVGYGKKVVGTEQIKKNADFIVDMASSLKSEGERYETFDSAYSRLGLSEKDLEESYKYHAARFNLFISFFGLGLVGLIYGLIQMSFSALAFIGFLSICLAQLFSSSFRMYQIRQRELLPVIEWIRNPSEWWIKPFVPRKEEKSLVAKEKKSNVTPIKRK